MGSWRDQARRLRREVYALALACRDPRVPWYVKALAAGLVAYALSPVDLIPDFIPVLGYLDDLVVIPLGVLLMRRWIPAEVWVECRAYDIEEARPWWKVRLLAVGLTLALAAFVLFAFALVLVGPTAAEYIAPRPRLRSTRTLQAGGGR
jgi:uncharacterized membrane protein YkvA (DUF1232 family)